MHPLQCVGKDGVTREFTCQHEYIPLSSEWIFRVRVISEVVDPDSFELVLEELDDETVRVIVLHNYGNPAYSGKGIPDALLPYAASTLGRKVQSSPTYADGGVFRTPAATKVWARLVGAGKATYDRDADIYQIA